MKLFPLFLATSAFGKINHCNKCFNQIKAGIDDSKLNLKFKSVRSLKAIY